MSTRLATRLASLAPLSPGPQRLAGKRDGRRQIESLLPLDGALLLPPLIAAPTQTLTTPASLGRESSHEIMSFRSIGPLETPGREAGSEGTSNWECLRGREPIDEASAPALDALPLRQSAHPCAWLVSNLLHAATAGRDVLWRYARAVLERDGYRCRVCAAPGRRKRSIFVHHRIPVRSLLPLMISLCPGCHSKGASHQGHANEHKPSAG